MVNTCDICSQLILSNHLFVICYFLCLLTYLLDADYCEFICIAAIAIILYHIISESVPVCYQQIQNQNQNLNYGR
jgi:hypothetical protein